MTNDHRDTIDEIKNRFIRRGKQVPTDAQCDMLLDFEIIFETHGLGVGFIDFVVSIAKDASE